MDESLGHGMIQFHLVFLLQAPGRVGKDENQSPTSNSYTRQSISVLCGFVS